MASIFTKDTLPGIYNDDFNDSDGYHQILFNSGRSLQARELTQLQSMIYEEMGRFGSNIFKEGSAVSFGGCAINSNYSYIQVETVTNGSFEDITVGSIFKGPAGNELVAKVISVHPISSISGSTTFTTNTLYVSYINNDSVDVSSEVPSFNPGEELGELGGNGISFTIHELGQDGATSPVGKGVRIDVDQGDFFVLGRFVHTKAQSIIISPYNQVISGTTIGFKVIQEVITVNDSNALYDNSGGGINSASPGADRYRIQLELTEKSSVTASDTFVFVAEVENSKIVEKVDTLDSYNKINDVLALRTNEESGDYIVNPFTIDFDSADADNLSLTISSGIAYVNGYRVENSSPVELIVPRSSGNVEVINNDVVPVSYGNYVLASSLNALPFLDNAPVQIYDSNNTEIIGECCIRGVETSGNEFKVYIFNIEITPGKSFSNATNLGITSNDDITLSTGTAGIVFETTNNDLLFPTSRPRPESFSDIIIITQRSQGSDGLLEGNVSNQITGMPVLAGAGSLTYTNTSLWIVVPNDGAEPAFVPTTVTLSGDSKSVTIEDPAILSKGYTVLYYLRDSNPSQKIKTLTTTTSNAVSVTNGVADLGIPDVFQIDTCFLAGSTTDVSERFILDDGQRDNFYDNSKLILKGGETDPGSIDVTYQYWARSNPSGAFYSPENYAGGTYGNIPDHVLQDGTTVSLRNFLDFRPDKDGNTFSNISYLPQNGTSIDADIAYYLPRADKVLMTQEGDLQVLMGQQSKDPQLKTTPNNSLELYQVLMNANTIDGDDVQIKPIEHKLYTMADIAQLDDELEDLREYTEFNIAELKAYHTPALDQNGDERPNSGIHVDGISDQSGAATDNDDYSAAIDPENNLIRPKVDEDNIRLIQDVNYGTQDVVKKGDNVYLNYVDEQWKYQDQASRTVKVNPFGMVDNVGVIKLSPSTDEWKESKEEAIRAISGASKLDVNQAFLWNNWQWNWKGRNATDVWSSLADTTNFGSGTRVRQRLIRNDLYNSSRTRRRGAGGHVRRVISSETLRMNIGGRYIDLALIPWIRSRTIFFHAKGLTPGTKFTPFFDGKDVSAWCKEETTFQTYSERTSDLGEGNQNTQSSITAHPDGAGELISNENGEIIGSFFIPNIRPEYYLRRRFGRRRIKNNYLRFRSGVREFKLLDINENNWSKANSKAFTYYTVMGALNNKSSNVLSTRGYRAVSPLSLGHAGFPSTYSPQELRNVLNQQTASWANTGIFEPQISGQYGPSTDFLNEASMNNLDTDGNMSKVLSDYINVDNKQYAGSTILPVLLQQNPLSQTFYVDNQFGLVLTKISLYFKNKDSGNLPVSVHLRPVVDGKPSVTDIVPDSHVYKNPSEISIPVESSDFNNITEIQNDFETIFEFEEPVFLQPWTNYAIVITSQSSQYELFSAKTNESVLGSAGQGVTTQSGNGSLFLPQNGVSWLESKNQDLMMKLTRAKFNLTGGTLMLKNSPLPRRGILNDPIRLVSGSSLVYVKTPCHGHAVGDSVILSGCLSVGNITDVDLNGTHIITAVDIHGYQFDCGTSATSDITGGGDACVTTINSIFDVANPNIESIIPNFSSLDFSAKFVTGIHISETDTALRGRSNNTGDSILASSFEKITPDQNIEFNYPRAIFHPEFATTASGVNSGTPGNTESVYIKADFKTSNDYVSPIIDLQRCSLTIAGDCIDDPVITNHIFPVNETEPSGGTTGSKHITTPITYEIPGVGLEVTAEVSVPANANIDFYYRVASSDQNINDLNWIQQSPVEPIPNQSTGQTSARWLVGGTSGTMNSFQQSQTKFVMRGTGEAPTIGSQYGKGGIVTRVFAQ